MACCRRAVGRGWQPRVGRRRRRTTGRTLGDPLGVIGRHVGEDGSQHRIIRHVLLVEPARHPGQRRQTAGPLEDRRGPLWIGHRVGEIDVPVHARAERLVLRLPAPAQRIMLPGGAIVSWLIVAGACDERDPAGDPIRPVLGHLHRPLALTGEVHLSARFDAVHGVAQRAGRTVSYGPDDHARAPRPGTACRRAPHGARSRTAPPALLNRREPPAASPAGLARRCLQWCGHVSSKQARVVFLGKHVIITGFTGKLSTP